MVKEATLVGVNFDLIPSDAVAVLAIDNLTPDRYKNTTNPRQLMRIGMIGEGVLTLVAAEDHETTVSAFVGIIVSADRSQVYWVNDTQPLP